MEVYANIAPLDPSQVAKTVAQRISLRSAAAISFGQIHHHANPAHCIWLLSARGERRRRRRTAEKCDELAPLHAQPRKIGSPHHISSNPTIGKTFGCVKQIPLVSPRSALGPLVSRHARFGLRGPPYSETADIGQRSQPVNSQPAL